MAIVFTKEPEGIYPAYNDSFIEFSSDLADNNKAEITIFPVEIFTRIFLIFPDADGKYLFNLKEAVKVVFNQNGFSDENFDTSIYWKSIIGLYLLQQIQINVFSDIDNEIVIKNYEFYKAVKQIGEAINSNPFQLLSFSQNGIDHEMTYFEGFPFHFDIQKVVSGSDITVKNLNTDNETAIMNPTTSEAFRIIIDRGGAHNWTSDNVLPLIEGLNRLEINEGGSFKSNLWITKKKKCSGVYLKWFNRSGGFSHYLFDRYFVEETKGSNLGNVLNNDFSNIPNAIGTHKSLGKKGEGTLIIKAKYDSSDYENIKDIVLSPLVQIYTSYEAYIEGRFIDVIVNTVLPHSNKREKNEIILNVELPGLITAKL